MVTQLIWIATIYVSAAIMIHMLHNRQQVRQTTRSRKWVHYIVITQNHESVVEGYIRALTFQALQTGKRLRVTFMDDGSSDGTLGIVSRLADSGCSIDLSTSNYTLQVSGDDLLHQGIVVDLRLSGQMSPLSFMRKVGDVNQNTRDLK